MNLAELQRAFARRILAGDDAILAEIDDNGRTDRATLMHVYEHAYGARLAEVLEADYEKLAAALGPEAFLQMAAAYTAAHPSDNPNARYFGRRLPPFLAGATPWRERPWLSELAALEWAMSEVFQDVDPPRLAIEAMAALHSHDWPCLRFDPVGDLRRLDFAHGGAEAWLALAEGADPNVAVEPGPAVWIVWRMDGQAQFRLMEPDEAWAFDAMARGELFQDLCDGLAGRTSPEAAATAMAGYLRGWIEMGVIAGFEIVDGA